MSFRNDQNLYMTESESKDAELARLRDSHDALLGAAKDALMLLGVNDALEAAIDSSEKLVLSRRRASKDSLLVAAKEIVAVIERGTKPDATLFALKEAIAAVEELAP